MDIVEELRRNRESGAKRLVGEYKAGLLALARRLYADPSDAEELVNRTFAAVVDGIDGFLEQSSFFTWMCQILVNLHANDTRRKSNAAIVYPGDVPDVEDESARDGVYRALDAALLRDAIETLPKDIRKTIVLHYFMEMSVRDIGRFLAVPAGTVMWRLHYARQMLAAKLGVVAKKPAGKALLVALALCGLTALGAATSLAVARLLSPPRAAAQEQQADDGKEGGAAQGQQAYDSKDGDAALEPQAHDSKADGTRQPSMATGTLSPPTTPQETTMKKASFLTASAALAAAVGAPFAASASMDTWQENAATPAVQLIVDADMTLTQALVANNASLSGAASVVKLGNGTVTVDDESGIGSFAGDIHVFAGGWSVGTASGFGTSAGATWVYPNGCVLVTDVTVSHTGETFHLAGTGKSDWYGWGAIRFPASSQESAAMAAGAYGSRWILEDDATVLVSGNGNGATFLPAIDLELNGHELTLWRGKYGTISTYSSATSKYGMFHSVTGAGGIVMENGVTFAQWGFTPPSYTAGNYLALQNAYLGIWQTKDLHADWGLVAKPLPAANWSGSGTATSHKPQFLLLSWKGADTKDHDFNRWRGPVTLEGDLCIGQENQNHIHPMTFTGKITGPGGLAVTTGKVWLYLDNPENDFEGGVTLHGPNDGLVLANDGALPADGGPLSLTDSTVSFPSTVSAPWSLPDLELAGTSTVGNCQGNWKTITVLADADAEYDSALGASNLVLKAGAALTIKSLFDPASYAGWEERYDLDHSTTDFDALPYTATKLSPDYFENDNFKWLADSNGANKTGTRTIAYSTYLWNNVSTDAVWTFAGHFGSHVYVWLNDQLILALTAGNAWRNPYRVTATLHPGANKLVILSDNNSWGATSDTNSGNDIGTWAGVKTKGFVYAVGDVPLTDSTVFNVPADPGDGSFCTTKSGDSALDGTSWSPVFQNLAMEEGSSLDLDALGSLSVETAKGVGSIANGDLAVTRALVVDPAIFENNGGLAVDGDLAFGSGAKITFPNANDYRDNPVGLYTLATATGSITGFDPSMIDLGDQRPCWTVHLSANGKTLQLELSPEGTVFFVR